MNLSSGAKAYTVVLHPITLSTIPSNPEWTLGRHCVLSTGPPHHCTANLTLLWCNLTSFNIFIIQMILLIIFWNCSIRHWCNSQTGSSTVMMTTQYRWWIPKRKNRLRTLPNAGNPCCLVRHKNTTHACVNYRATWRFKKKLMGAIYSTDLWKTY